MPTTNINLNLSYVESIVAGTNITVDDTDPQNPIVSATGGGSGITGVGTVDYVPRILTIDGDGNILTMVDTKLSEVIDVGAGSNYGQYVLPNTSGASAGGWRIGTDGGQLIAYWGIASAGTITNITNGLQAYGSNLFIKSPATASGTAGELMFFGSGSSLGRSNVKTSDLQVLTVAGQGTDANYVLTTDGAGVASWQPVSGGGGTTTNPLTIGTGLSGTSFDGSAAVTIEIDSTVATLTGSQVLTNKTLTSPVIGAIVGLNGQIAHTTTAQASGAITDFTFTPSNHTGQTASTNSPVFKIAASTKTFATGAITNAYGVHFDTQTIAFSSASTITNGYGLFVNTLSSTTITNDYGIGTNGFLRILVGSGAQGTIIRNDTTANYAAIYNGNVTPTNLNFAVKYSANSTWINTPSGGLIYLAYGAVQVLNISSATAMTIAEGVSMNAGTTTGLKIGGATTQKLALWNKTPIVQPTTAITGATLVSNAGTTITSTDTFGGYTLQQIAAALVNFGLLA